MMWNASLRRLAALAGLAACGCSAMRELPRDEYARLPERSNVRVETVAGAALDFERVEVSADSLTGLRPRGAEGAFSEYDRMSLPLSDVRRMSVRSIDWYRTGLIGGVAAAVALAAVLSQNRSGDSGNGTGPCGSRPCP